MMVNAEEHAEILLHIRKYITQPPLLAESKLRSYRLIAQNESEDLSIRQQRSGDVEHQNAFSKSNTKKRKSMFTEKKLTLKMNLSRMNLAAKNAKAKTKAMAKCETPGTPWGVQNDSITEFSNDGALTDQPTRRFK